jgi:hypothetical protein
MDADLQHDERLRPRMLLRSEPNVDAVAMSSTGPLELVTENARG